MEMSFQVPEEVENQIKAEMYEACRDAFEKFGKQTTYPDYMDLGQACSYLNVARNTLNGFIREGLPVSIIGNVKRISKRDINNFMDENAV
ncbi:helix-turn-helix domain-containing protein [Lactiplantibacillus plantarum]|uniref:helix-turn-helix domain-containing protein n=1 Tax=Lactiplantibacillus plantarum TaxID=1590 RepID=UPI00209F5787|nr:helix-turn-helix domain-containing protein [Lactiplantibacillus plantarum]USZ60692.1 helix-turn-helix domain-containing protein [Lactiplantibacillus plantarum]